MRWTMLTVLRQHVSAWGYRGAKATCSTNRTKNNTQDSLGLTWYITRYCLQNRSDKGWTQSRFWTPKACTSVILDYFLENLPTTPQGKYITKLLYRISHMGASLWIRQLDTMSHMIMKEFTQHNHSTPTSRLAVIILLIIILWIISRKELTPECVLTDVWVMKFLTLFQLVKTTYFIQYHCVKSVYATITMDNGVLQTMISYDVFLN